MEELAQSAMDAVTDGRVKIVPARYAKRLSRLARRKARLAGQPAAVVGTSDSGLVRADGQRRRSEAGLCRPRRRRLAARRRARPMADLRRRRSTWPKTRSPATRSRRTPTCSTPGSARPSGRTRRLGWPDETPELEYYYPTSALVTSRDIITLWVARMVLTGLYNVGEVPFREVYHPPQDSRRLRRGMSKSKGNGVDPLDVIEKVRRRRAAVRPGVPDDRNAGRARCRSSSSVRIARR